MSTIKQLLRLHLQGVSNRKIGEQIGLYKGTVNRLYPEATGHRPDRSEELLDMEDPVLEGLFHGGIAGLHYRTASKTSNLLYRIWKKARS